MACGRDRREGHEEGLGNDEGGHGGNVTATLGDGFEGCDAHVEGRDTGDAGGQSIGLEHSGSDGSLHQVLHPTRLHKSENLWSENSAGTVRRASQVEGRTKKKNHTQKG